MMADAQPMTRMISMIRLALNSRKCLQCGVCAGACSYGALTLERPDMIPLFRPELCVSCGLCADVCPTRAIRTDPREPAGPRDAGDHALQPRSHAGGPSRK